MEKEGGRGGSRWREERREKGLGEGMPKRGEAKCFFGWVGRKASETEWWEPGLG